MESIHSLYQEFQNKVKRDQSLDAPDRMSIPLPLQYVFCSNWLQWNLL